MRELLTLRLIFLAVTIGALLSIAYNVARMFNGLFG